MSSSLWKCLIPSLFKITLDLLYAKCYLKCCIRYLFEIGRKNEFNSLSEGTLNLKKKAKFRLDIRKNILTVMSEKMLEGAMKRIWEVSILRNPQNKKIWLYLSLAYTAFLSKGKRVRWKSISLRSFLIEEFNPLRFLLGIYKQPIVRASKTPTF